MVSSLSPLPESFTGPWLAPVVDKKGVFANLDIDETKRTALIILHPYDFILIAQQAVSGIP